MLLDETVMVCVWGERLTYDHAVMIEERVVKGTFGAVGGAAAGAILRIS